MAAHKKKPATPQSPPGRPSACGSDSHTHDTEVLFHRLYAEVKPLRPARGRVPRKTDNEAPPDRPHELGAEGRRFEVADDGHRVQGRRVDVPLDALRRLRRGLLPIDARLDLHGMRAAQARAQLELFLRTMRSRKERCVLVIHGKGEHSPQGLGVLRGEIAAWLSQSASSQHVAAFATAREGDGGQGAVYVLLRK